MPLKLEVSI